MIRLVWPGKPRGLPDVAKFDLRVDEYIGSPDCDENRLICGDNLQVAHALMPSLGGKIDLLYVDPPFASGADYHLTAGVRQSARKTKAYGDVWRDHAEFLSFLYVRLIVFRELLSPEGTLWLHLDDNSVHDAKLLCDEIFGAQNCRGEIIWRLGNGAKSRKFFSVQHNTILAYSKGHSWVFHPDSPLVREPFADLSQKMHFQNVDAVGRRYRRRTINGKDYVYFADDGKLVGSVWNDISSMAANSPVLPETTGYPTQKPQKLLERIIAACSNEGALVADFFSGSGTTLAAADRLGRRWLGVDNGSLAHVTARKRLLSQGARGALQHPPSADFSLQIGASRAFDGLQIQLVEGAGQVDSWSIDSDFRGVFRGVWHAHRTRKQADVVTQATIQSQGNVAILAFSGAGDRATRHVGGL